MSRMLETLLNESKRTGWAVAAGTLAQVQMEAAVLHWTMVPTRRGGPAVATLRPTSPAEAQPNSLSARYGMGPQPLHTDGAHLVHPPDVVILACESTSTTPTRLWNEMIHGPWVKGAADAVQHGVFLVNGGNDSFFATAYAKQRLRFDPGCMTPCDARARALVEFFKEATDNAIEHQWTEPGQVLLINNRRVLHARASAADDPQREIKRISFRLNGEVS
ncbi:TauD/TfdA family dioxygenase [Streptomycetaceae bacterium NBC_01309]